MQNAKLNTHGFVTADLGMGAYRNHLKSTGIVLLGEVATVAYKHPQYQKIGGAPYQYQEFLGAIWRESAENYLQPGEKIMTIANLFYADDQGKSMVEA